MQHPEDCDQFEAAPVDKPVNKSVNQSVDKPCHCTSQAKAGSLHPQKACVSTLTAYETSPRHLVASTQPKFSANTIVSRVCIWRVQGTNFVSMTRLSRGRLYLGNVVISVALQLDGDATAQPGCQGLTSVPCQLDVNGVCWQACLTKLLRHLVAQSGTGGPVLNAHPVESH